MPNPLTDLLAQMQNRLASASIENWQDIDAFLEQARQGSAKQDVLSAADMHERLSTGMGFITFDFGIDGVSIEIFKYAQCLESLYSTPDRQVPLHFIGGDFYDKADVVLKPHWNRFCIPGINGWSKWYDGKWFSKLYYEDMPEGSHDSDEVSLEIWRQTTDFADRLGTYLVENNIALLIPVNIPTNPGNLAIMLAIAIVTESLGTYVISSNHDFYWEGGTPASEKQPGDEPGPRDHFFKNVDNQPFFDLFKKLYPWNGDRWLQVNINSPQSKALVTRFGFDPNRVFELGTSISDEFFAPFTFEDQKQARLKMAYVLTDGSPTINPLDVREHLAGLSDWMGNQRPLVCGVKAGLLLDSTTDKTIYCLQPTRVIARKRIEMDFQMLQALFQHAPFRETFEDDPERQLVVHITGPTPVEHQDDLETVLYAYMALCDSVSESVAERIFIAFSVGTEDHPNLAPNGLEPMCIEQIYRLATVILFPSETEGRGLPIIESSAGGVPIICSRYYPEEVFAEVVGEALAEVEQIRYLLFPAPEVGYTPEFLDGVTDLLLHPDQQEALKIHNQRAVELRYSTEMIHKKFELFTDVLRAL